MWLYVPYPSAPDSAASISDLSSLADLCAQSLTWNGKSRQPAFWRRALQTDTLRPLRFGQISQASMGSHWQEWLTSFAEDSHAPTTALPADVVVDSVNMGASGITSRESLARLDPESSAWKTCQESLFDILQADGDGILKDANGRVIGYLPGCGSFLETWPRSGTMRSGSAYARPTCLSQEVFEFA